MQENERLPDLLARLARLEHDVCKYDEKFSDLVKSINIISISLNELSTRIDTGVKTICVFFGVVAALTGAFWTYNNHVESAIAKQIEFNHEYSQQQNRGK